MKQFVVTLAGVFAGLLLFFVAVPIILIVWAVAAAKPASASGPQILSLDLRQTITDQEPASALSILGGRKLSVLGVVQGLRRASRDDDVKGLFIRLPEGGLAPAAADEIRVAVKAFRAAGKPVIAHSQGLYPSGSPVSSYMVGAASGDLWMQPAASLQAVGAAHEEMFLKRAFDKYGITADYQQRYEYKNAVNPYLHDDFTPAHKEATLSYLGSIYDTETAAAAADRSVDVAALKAKLEAGPYVAEDALKAGLIDHLGQVNEAESALRAKAGKDVKLIDFAAYDRARDDDAGTGSAIGLIAAEGDIITGTSRDEGFGSSGGQIYSDDLANAFARAVKDPDIKAIVLRVSSPGGSDTASEQILAAVRQAKAAGKPVVVSMGTYAASGGYLISSEASEIIADSATLTGSIGVFGGKFVIGPALARFGVDLHGVSVGGSFADAYGSAAGFTPQQKAAFSAWMDRIYDKFVGDVARGRKLPDARVREIAKGRVWTGAQALELGLVDKVGGFQLAVDEATRLGGLKAGSRLKKVTVRKSPFEGFRSALGAGARSVAMLDEMAWLLTDPKARALMDEAMRARMGVAASTVRTPALP